jgi:AAA15 family ATPase/GTPase
LFSQLREKGGTQELIAFLRTTFPFIENIEVLVPAGTPALSAALSSGGVRQLQLLSSGIHKIISILLACASVTKGVILIDELENGIFYDKYELTWNILNKFSKQYNCQLFVTSHSVECLRALVPTIGDDVASFSLIRTERENGKCIVRHQRCFDESRP